MVDTVLTAVVSMVVGVFGGGAIWGYVKDRRSSAAAGTVAQRTIELQVDVHRMQNLETRFAMAERAWDEERETLTRRMLAAEEREAHLELRLEEKESKVLELQERIDRLNNTVAAMTMELNELNREVGELRTRNP